MTPKEMYDEAMKILQDVEDCVPGAMHPQVTVLLGESGSLYIAVNDLMGSVCRKLDAVGEVGVAAMMTVWKDGGTDLSALNFRRSMLLWNPSCENTLVLLGDGEEFTSRPLKDTLPPR